MNVVEEILANCLTMGMGGCYYTVVLPIRVRGTHRWHDSPFFIFCMGMALGVYDRIRLGPILI